MPIRCRLTGGHPSLSERQPCSASEVCHLCAEEGSKAARQPRSADSQAILELTRDYSRETRLHLSIHLAA